MSFVSDLEPKPLWRHFDAILEIPRASKREDRLRDHVIALAERRGLEHRVDDAGNVVVRKPGTPGHEAAPATILQSHLDMVQEKNSDSDHDFERDPIRPRREGDYLKATGTTLGADNGIGVATMLAVMEAEDWVHGPLELLFTIDEETGLTGATRLGDDLLEGRRLLNLDSEEEGVITIGCAGGGDTELHLALDRGPRPSEGAFEVRVSGLKGGHSGIDIHLQRGNAIRLLARALYGAALDVPFRLASIRGGSAHNAIPREAAATVVADDPRGADRLRERLRAELAEIREEYAAVEPGLKAAVEPAQAPPTACDRASTGRLLRLLTALPHGVEAMSRDIPGLVETSTNLATVGEDDKGLTILLSSRSSVASAMTAIRRRIRALGELAGARVDEHDGYPGWQPNVDSALLVVVREVTEGVLGRPPEIGAVHAGLECGIIGEKYSGMDMVSIGPQIEFPHSPDERVEVGSVATFYETLRRTLERLA